MINDDLAFWVALIQFRQFGAVRMGRLNRYFPDMERAFNASVGELIEAGIEPEVANRFLQEKTYIEPETLMRELEVNGIQAITTKHDVYPPLLKEIYDPPAVLFVRGVVPDPNRKHLAVVGSRKASQYGIHATETIVEQLAISGVVIVSGLAYGIDATAHDTALKADGTTIAVLGSGVDQDSIYPSHNRALASRIIAQGGALISEFPIGTPPLKSNFPFRNRIIAGMCHGTLVVEAAIKSGSLITARSALESGREVYAVPGQIFSTLSEGPNNLIKMGAIPVTSPQDIFGVQLKDKLKITYQPANTEEETILRLLGSMPVHADEIIRSSKLAAQKVGSTLTMLEMKGAIKHEGGNYYTRLS